MDVPKSSIGKLLIEGKTKQVYELKNDAKSVYVLSKDRITAGDGVKAHEMVGKSIVSTQTNCAIFEYLNAVGVRTHFVSRVGSSNPDHERAFVARNCAMVPIEWVTRRVATGSYLKRHPNVKEGYRFAPPKLETFFKDDANHDPFWSTETLIEAGLDIGGLIIGRPHVEEMFKVTLLVFEILERAWQSVDHALIDMKIEFGVVDGKSGKEIVVADVIDNDSWRLWPSGDKRLMLDKQLYRNLDHSQIDEKAMQALKEKFELVRQRSQDLFRSLVPSSVKGSPIVAILIGSLTDIDHANKIKSTLANKFGIYQVEIHVCSAHKATEYALDVIAGIQQWPSAQVIIASAGRSNGLGPVTGANSPIPVINCPPASDLAALELDIWSSLRLPSGIGSPTILGTESAAQCAAHIVANSSPFVWSKIRSQQVYTITKMLHDDAALNK